MIEILAACHLTQLAAMYGDRRNTCPPAPQFSGEPPAPVYLARLIGGFAALGALLIVLGEPRTLPCDAAPCTAEASAVRDPQ